MKSSAGPTTPPDRRQAPRFTYRHWTGLILSSLALMAWLAFLVWMAAGSRN